jgi:hypothetical protein
LKEDKLLGWVCATLLVCMALVGIFFGHLYPEYKKRAYPCKLENNTVLKGHPARGIVAKMTGRAEDKVLVCTKPEFTPIAQAYMYNDVFVVGVSQEFLALASGDELEAALAHESGHYLAGHFNSKTLSDVVIYRMFGEIEADDEAVKLVGDCKMARLFRVAQRLYDERKIESNFYVRAERHERIGGCNPIGQKQ